MRRFLVACLILAGLLAGTRPARAGVYNLSSLDQSWPLLHPYLQYRLVKLSLADLQGCHDKVNEERQRKVPPIPTSFRRTEILPQLAELEKREQINALTTLDRVDLSGCLIRLGRYNRAIEVLEKASNDPADPGRFLILAHQANAWFKQNELGRAIAYQKEALAAWPTCTPWWDWERTIFYRRTETAFLRLMEKRNKETGKWTTVDDIFPGVKFDDRDARYETETLDVRYTDLLPTDAPLTVLQLLVWEPADDRLLWLYGEVANARQQVLVAADIFKELIDPRGHTDVRTLVRHRQILKEAADKLHPILNALNGDNPYIYQQMFWAFQPRGGLIGPLLGVAATDGVNLQGPVAFRKFIKEMDEIGDVRTVPPVEPTAPPFVLEWRQIIVAFVFGLFTAVLVRAQVQEWRRRGMGLSSPAEPAPRGTPPPSEEVVVSGSSGKSELAP